MLSLYLPDEQENRPAFWMVIRKEMEGIREQCLDEFDKEERIENKTRNHFKLQRAKVEAM